MTNTQQEGCQHENKCRCAGILKCHDCWKPLEELEQEEWIERFDKEFRGIITRIDAKYADNETGYLYDALKQFIHEELLQARKEAREETLRKVINILNYPGADADYNVQKILDLLNKQCKANCDAQYKMGYAKGIATHVNVDLVKQGAKKEMLTDIEQEFKNGRKDALREVIEMIQELILTATKYSQGIGLEKDVLAQPIPIHLTGKDIGYKKALDDLLTKIEELL